MNKYSDIEIQTAKNLLKKDYKWIVRDESGRLFAHTGKPSKVSTFWWSVGVSKLVCDYVPIFQSIRFGDKEPVSLESIVHSQILDDAEKRYLKGVIRPFRDRVKYIAKICVDHLYDEPDYHICIIFNDGNDAMNFPSFDASHMYKCMEEDRAYTLDELGL